ncbi:translation initiation factor IF-2-like [Choloepus didactylus]|uniref:translation initiation factor IF-2-like n=1 Tax=Choloepus didactylus TaxID=27675 RepID=UPI00189D9BDC|nr:translation initiation factor IF-2-like [Choloepus didactylus]
MCHRLVIDCSPRCPCLKQESEAGSAEFARKGFVSTSRLGLALGAAGSEWGRPQLRGPGLSGKGSAAEWRSVGGPWSPLLARGEAGTPDPEAGAFRRTRVGERPSRGGPVGSSFPGAPSSAPRFPELSRAASPPPYRLGSSRAFIPSSPRCARRRVAPASGTIHGGPGPREEASVLHASPFPPGEPSAPPEESTPRAAAELALCRKRELESPPPARAQRPGSGRGQGALRNSETGDRRKSLLYFCPTLSLASSGHGGWGALTWRNHSFPEPPAPPPSSCLRQGQHPLFAAFPERAARERKREASKIPEWIDRCYVIGAASSTPQEARSWGERGSPAAGATAVVCLPHRSQELGIQEEAASFVSGVIVGGPLWLLGFESQGGTPGDLGRQCLEPGRGGPILEKPSKGKRLELTWNFSPGAIGCSSTLPPSFLHTCSGATSSTADSSWILPPWVGQLRPNAGGEFTGYPHKKTDGCMSGHVRKTFPLTMHEYCPAVAGGEDGLKRIFFTKKGRGAL